MKMNIYVDFENKKVYSEKTLYKEADKMAEELDRIRGDRFEDFLCKDDKYYSYHDYNINSALNILRYDMTEFEIEA